MQTRRFYPLSRRRNPLLTQPAYNPLVIQGDAYDVIYRLTGRKPNLNSAINIDKVESTLRMQLNNEEFRKNLNIVDWNCSGSPYDWSATFLVKITPRFSAKLVERFPKLRK